MYWLDVTIHTTRIIALPFWWLAKLVFYLLHSAASPFIYIGFIVKELILLPARFLAPFEALWYFLMCAVLVGGVAGCSIYGVLRLCVFVFDLDRKPVPRPIPAKGHNAVSYRAARAEKKERAKNRESRHAIRAKLLASQPLIQEVVREARSRPIALTSPLSPNTGTAATRSGLFQDIILEQTDESDESLF